MIYLKTVLIVGLVSGVIVPFITCESIPSWPDTAIFGAMIGLVAALGAIQHRRTNVWAWEAVRRMFRRPQP